MGLPVHHPQIVADLVELDGQLLYVLNDNLEVWDVADINNPVLMGEASLTGTPEEVLLIGDILCVAISTYGIVAFDVSNPAAPLPASTYELNNDLADMCLVSGYLALLDSQLSIHMLDISQPEQISLLSLTENAASSTHCNPTMESFGDSFLVCSYYSPEVGIPAFILWDVSTPQNLQPHGIINGEMNSSAEFMKGFVVLGNKIAYRTVHPDQDEWGYTVLTYRLGFLGIEGEEPTAPIGPQIGSDNLQVSDGHFFQVNPSSGVQFYHPESGAKTFFINHGDPASIKFSADKLAICSPIEGLSLWQGNLLSAVTPLAQIGTQGYGTGKGYKRISQRHWHYSDGIYIERFYTQYQLFDLADPGSVQLVREQTLNHCTFPIAKVLSPDWYQISNFCQNPDDQRFTIYSTRDGSFVLEGWGRTILVENNVLFTVSQSNGQLDSYLLDPLFGSTHCGSFPLKFDQIRGCVLLRPDLLLVDFYKYGFGDGISFFDISNPSQVRSLSTLSMDFYLNSFHFAHNDHVMISRAGQNTYVVDFSDPRNPILFEGASQDLYERVYYSNDGYFLGQQSGYSPYEVLEWTGSELVPTGTTFDRNPCSFTWEGNYGYYFIEKEVLLYRLNNFQFEFIGRAYCPDSTGELEIHDNMLFAGEYILPLHEAPSPPLRASIPVQNGNAISTPPPALGIICSPNPFNPKVNIVLANRKSQRTRVEIFDLRGHKMATLSEGLLPEGENAFSWSGKNQQGQPAPSGTYFLRVESEAGIQTKKLLLMR